MFGFPKIPLILIIMVCLGGLIVIIATTCLFWLLDDGPLPLPFIATKVRTFSFPPVEHLDTRDA